MAVKHDSQKLQMQTETQTEANTAKRWAFAERKRV